MADKKKDEAEDTKDKAVKDLIRYLDKKYPSPRHWALDMSVFFKVLAVNDWKISQFIEGDADSMGTSTSGSIDRSKVYPIGGMKLLRDFSDHHLQEVIAEVAANARKQGVDVISPHEAQAVKSDSGDTASFNFEAKRAYTVRVTEDPPTSALSSLIFNGNGPATVTISVQKKDGVTANINDNGDAKSEGSESA